MVFLLTFRHWRSHVDENVTPLKFKTCNMFPIAIYGFDANHDSALQPIEQTYTNIYEYNIDYHWKKTINSIKKPFFNHKQLYFNGSKKSFPVVTRKVPERCPPRIDDTCRARRLASTLAWRPWKSCFLELKWLWFISCTHTYIYIYIIFTYSIYIYISLIYPWYIKDISLIHPWYIKDISLICIYIYVLYIYIHSCMASQMVKHPFCWLFQPFRPMPAQKFPALSAPVLHPEPWGEQGAWRRRAFAGDRWWMTLGKFYPLFEKWGLSINGKTPIAGWFI